MTTTNLGNIASCKVLTASESVIALSFTQPNTTVGTPAAPSATGNTQAYVAGINKYVYYFAAGATTVALAQTFDLTGLPAAVLSTYSISAVVNWALVGTTVTATVLPVYSHGISVLNDTDSVGSASVKVASTTAPTFSAGTAVYKVVISLNAD